MSSLLKSENKSILTLFGLLLLVVPVTVRAQYGYSTNADGSVYTYNTNAGGNATIDGYAGPPWVVTIPTSINGLTVTSIGETAFLFSAKLTGVTISSNVSSIGDSAFTSCDNLSGINIPDGVTNIGESAFSYCVSLSNIAIPGSVTTIGDSTFANCTGLTNVMIGNGTTAILLDAFEGCTSLTNITFPSSVTNIGEGAFAATGLTNVTIPDNVTSISGDAFQFCSNLTSVTIPNRVTDIGEYAFEECTSLTNLVIPSSVTNIGYFAFENCTNLSGIFFTGNAPNADSASMYDGNTKETAYYLAGATGWIGGLNSFTNYTGLSAVLWNPLIQSAAVKNNQFEFDIAGTANIPIVVQACTHLANPVWTPLTNVSLTNGSYHFTDPNWTNYSTRYYSLGFQ